MIVGEVQVDSLKRCVALAKQFEQLTLAEFQGENVRDFCKAAHSMLIQLERDDQLPKTHLITLVDAFTACTVMDFRIQWMTKRPAVEAFVRDSAGKDKAAVAQMVNKIRFTDLLEEAKTMFNNLQDKWGTTQSLQAKNNALIAQMAAMTAKLNGVEQQLKAKAATPPAAPGGGGCRGCYNCGAPDHVKSQCPHQRPVDPKWNAPQPGEPTSKMIDDKMFHWCPKCGRGKGRWSSTHKASEHVGGWFQNRGGASGGAANNSGDNNGASGSPQPAGTVAEVTESQLLAWFNQGANE